MDGSGLMRGRISLLTMGSMFRHSFQMKRFSIQRIVWKNHKIVLSIPTHSLDSAKFPVGLMDANWFVLYLVTIVTSYDGFHSHYDSSPSINHRSV